MTPEDSVSTSFDREGDSPYRLRRPEAGDLGWIVHCHGVVYFEEYGWNDEFEGLVARIVSDYVKARMPDRERLWVAEIEGHFVGCVLLVRDLESDDVARLRLLLVERVARGRGLGQQLVGECSQFAKGAGYKRIVLWTNDVLTGARRIYERQGYQLMREYPHHSFGKDLVAQEWELNLLSK